MNFKFILLFIVIAILLIIDFTINRNRKTPLKSVLNSLSETKLFALDREKDSCKKLVNDLKEVEINITPELFNVLTLFLSIVTIIIVIFLSYIYKFNLLINYEELKVASEVLGNPELIKIDLNLNINILLITFLMAIVLPRLILKICVKIKLLLEEKEVIMLQTYTLMLIKSGKPVKEILISLKERSRMFKKILEKAVNGFSTDNNKSLSNARESTANSGFEKVIRALEQCLNNDRNTSLKFLTNHRRLTKELKSLEKNKKNSTKNIVGTILLIVPLLTFTFIFGYPIFAYALRMLGSMPF